MPRYPNTPNNVAGRIREYIHHLAAGGDQYSDLFSSMLSHRIISGGIVSAPTTASTQATGAGTLAWRCNISYVYLAGDADYGELAANADFVIHNGATTITNLYTQVAAVIVSKNPSTNALKFFAVKGTAQTTASGLATGPTDAAIQTAVNSDYSVTNNATWWKLAEVSLSRTADTTLATAVNYNARGDRGIWLQNW